VLLVILQISCVNAQNDNDTDVINQTMDYPEFSNNDNLQNDENQSQIGEVNKIEFNQGDKIPISINGRAEGNLKVLVDDKEYDSFNFKHRETIYISTYHPESFFNSSIMNINPGLHNVSLIFDFKSSFKYYVEGHIDENSTLNFYFAPNFSEHVLNNMYTFNFSLNILKKKTIHITDFVFVNLCEYGEYKVHLDNYDENNYNDTFGIIISKKDEIFYKKACYNLWADSLMTGGLDSPVDVGIYNFTVVNLVDGTIDEVIFKTIKYRPKLNITHIINESNILFHIINPMPSYWPWCYIKVDNITKEEVITTEYDEDGVLDVSFENLSAGIHTVTIYCPEDECAEAFFYEMTFEIEDNHTDSKEENSTSVNQTDSNVTNTTIPIINGNSTGNTTNPFRGSGKNHINIGKSNKYYNKNSKKVFVTPAIGEISDSSSSQEPLSHKSYEISKKSVSKPINNLVTELWLIVISFISLLFGYFKFKKNY